ncbi:myosin phosphatase Rho-interacting protein-like [Salminus brasiliensis]|uniref:myosin phosphatase Rho-interacting protein-like n=1 Tax=Salminus brasiliensis TaxID=930266 RepID=UPI003B83129D
MEQMSCSKFQANIFDKSRCQNCFKSRELHLMTDEEFEQAKPIYASWLCLAPEGTDFDNPMHRSRKWQRRFFILYEHGRLQFSLDESPSTIPQGTVDLSLGTEVVEAEARTGQKNALCIITSEQEIFIRGDSKEIINGWSEQLIVFQQINNQNQVKIHEVSSVPYQEKALATTAVCGIAAPDIGTVAGNELCSPEQEEGQSPDETAASAAVAAADSLGSGKCRTTESESEHKIVSFLSCFAFLILKEIV